MTKYQYLPIVSFFRKERSLLDYRQIHITHKFRQFFKDAKLAMSDHEVAVLLFWAVISAGAALSYLIWLKYPRLRTVAAALFAASLLNFVGQ